MWSQVGPRQHHYDKASGGNGIPVELFQILKMMLWKCCIQYANKSGKQQWPQDWKVRFHSNPKERQCQECSNYCTIALTSQASKVMLKILQARLQQYMDFQMFKLDLEKAEEPEIKVPTSVGSSKKRVPGKHLLYWLYQSLWLYRSQQTEENSPRDGNTRPPDLPPEKSVCRSRSNS